METLCQKPLHYLFLYIYVYPKLASIMYALLLIYALVEDLALNCTFPLLSLFSIWKFSSTYSFFLCIY